MKSKIIVPIVVVILVVAAVVLAVVANKTANEPQKPIAGATPQEEFLNNFNYWLKREGAHQVVIDPVLQEVADTAIKTISTTRSDLQPAIEQLLLSDENIKKVQDFIIAKGYHPGHINELWGHGEPGYVAEGFVEHYPGRATIREKGNKYTRIGVSSIKSNGEDVFFIILGDE